MPYVECILRNGRRSVVGLGNSTGQAKHRAENAWRANYGKLRPASCKFDEYIKKSEAPDLPEDRPELVSISLAAQMLNVSKQTVQNYITAEKIHGQKVGKQWVLFKRDVEQLRHSKQILPTETVEKRTAQELADAGE